LRKNKLSQESAFDDMRTGQAENGNRPPAFAGRFYPAGSGQLQDELDNLFKKGKQPEGSEQHPRALIVPHAGYVFSGQVAASAYNQLLPGYSPKRVFILASSHYHSFAGVSVFYSGDYETPLGRVAVDRETGLMLKNENPLFVSREEAHADEHSLEVQLPFLQKKLGNEFLLVPLILGFHRPEECRQLAEALLPYFIPGNLFVISTDLSHYPRYEDAVDTDRNTTEAILSNSPERLLKMLGDHKKQNIGGLVTSLCGWTSVLTLLYLTEGRNYAYKWLDYLNSGDQPLYGDRQRVVGYSAIGVYPGGDETFSLSQDERDSLLKIAGNAIRQYVLDDSRDFRDTGEISGKLAENWGAFVSIYVKGKLRGCIGRFENPDPLYKTVHEVAISSTTDRRFPPLSAEELDELAIEISVLSPLKKISSPKEIVLGKHGIYIRKGWATGTFLPQVAEKYGWSVDEFLGRCARDKAGIGWDGWKSAELFVYEALVFGNDH
jgi:MEMO1 family protein